MKKTILVMLMVLMVSTPCFAEVELIVFSQLRERLGIAFCLAGLVGVHLSGRV